MSARALLLPGVSQFLASIAVITSDSQKSRELFIDALGLPLGGESG
jgi:hypothetical protein